MLNSDAEILQLGAKLKQKHNVVSIIQKEIAIISRVPIKPQDSDLN